APGMPSGPWAAPQVGPLSAAGQTSPSSWEGAWGNPKGVQNQNSTPQQPRQSPPPQLMQQQQKPQVAHQGRSPGSAAQTPNSRPPCPAAVYVDLSSLRER
ncbi:unnamed protein product, partial [Polarella glacialis]